MITTLVRIWDNATFSFLKAYRKCLRFSDKPGALLVEHARKSVEKIRNNDKT